VRSLPRGWPLAPGWPARLALLVPLGVYLFVWPFGLALLSLGWLPPGAGWVGGVLLIAQGLALTAWLALQVGPRRALLVSGGIALAAWALEAVGVTTGVPFGPYRYTPALGAWLGPVPAAIPFAWVASVGSAYFLCRFWILDFGFWNGEKISKIQNLKSKIDTDHRPDGSQRRIARIEDLFQEQARGRRRPFRG